MNSENKFISLEEISKRVGISKKTTHIQMKQIKQLIETKYTNQAKILISHQGYKLERDISFSIQVIIINILQEQLLFELVIVAAKNETEHVKKFLEKNYTSLTQFYSYQKNLNAYLKKYSIKIIANPYIHFDGEEHKIRLFLFDFYCEFFQSHEWPFENVSKLVIQEIVVDIEHNMKCIIEISQKKKLQYVLAICLLRIKIGKIIKKSIDSEYKNYSILYKNIDIYNVISNDIFLCEKEIENELFCLFNLSNIFDLMPLSYWNIEEIDNKNSINDAIDFISKMIDDIYVLAGKETKKTESVIQLFLSIYQKQRYFDICFKEEIENEKKNIPLVIVKTVNYYVEKLLFLNDKNEFPYKNELLSKGFLCSLFPLIDDTLNNIRVKIYTMGTSYEHVLQKLELERREKNVNILDNSLNEEVDLIISDFYIEEVDHATIFIRSFPSTEKDWELLNTLINKVKLELKNNI
ncbi:helix-turn-helix domain-containing protein [Carnobacterium maltaromaticum]|uniref:helix-turn-helix domain-containing protein n=1 Tax=Carnobacterium maltaromaticum TaxID=2751 RepID=UPI00295E7129|nr:helix-turn-helix domain-containing protein [Carnobacterium maltaromaticum]